MAERRETGRRAEELAAASLKRSGLKVLHTNLRLGRLGEIDLVCDDAGYLVIVEVKARFEGGIGGLEHINAAKIRKLGDLAAAYMAKHPAKIKGLRFDAVEVVFKDSALREADIRHIRDAFRL